LRGFSLAIRFDPESAGRPPSAAFTLTGASLLALLGLTVGVAYLDLGWLNTPLAMTISAAKAVVIILFFMHVRRASGLVKLFAVAGFFWLAVMFALAFSDFAARGW
jgi:cytochrome c oxidase subunit 4